MMNTLIRLILLVTGMMLSANALAVVKAYVDRNNIQEGDTFQLIIESDSDQPDLSPLNNNFDVLGTSRSSQMSFVNGSMSSSTRWSITLSPKHAGSLTIPPLRVGNDVTPFIAVRVTKVGSSHQRNGKAVLLESFVEPKSAYPQQQIIFTLRLYNNVPVRDGALSAPQADDVVIEKIGNDVTYQTAKGGVSYSVTERKYALFPQKTGKIVIPSITFEGQVGDRSASGSAFNVDPFNQFFAQMHTRSIRLHSDPVTLNVVAPPKSFDGNLWLPAKKLTLTETWNPSKKEYKTGEPVTRTVRLTAEGLTGAQLPELPKITNDKLKVYNDQPVVDTKNMQDALTGVREEKFAIIPLEKGEINLPAIEVKWWNTQTNQEEIARLPAEKINVIQGDVPISNTRSNTPTAIPAPTQTPAAVNNSPADASTHKVPQETDERWKWAFMALFLVWMLTLLAWIWSRRKSPGTSDKPSIVSTSAEAYLKQFRYFCEQNKLNEARNTLVSWAEAYWPGVKIRGGLSEIAGRLGDPRFTTAVDELNRTRYQNSPKNWDGHAFYDIAAAAIEGKEQSAKALKSRNGELPALYPNYSRL